MSHKIEAIDYLRGLSIVLIILLHVILYGKSYTLHSPFYSTAYAQVPLLYSIRDILNFSVVTLIICSGFSIFMTHKDLQLNKKSILEFYKKRLKRIIIPWAIFGVVYFAFHALIYLVFKLYLVDISFKGMVYTLFFVPGALVFLILILSFLFPYLKYLYQEKKPLLTVMVLAYLVFFVISVRNPFGKYHSPNLNLNFISLGSFILVSILGGSLIYLTGFFLEDLYNSHKRLKKELKVTFNFVFLFIIIYITYKLIGLETAVYLNKIPPSPYYLSLGLASTFVLLSLFFAYKKFIHIHLKKLLSFFSDNSYWLFLWDSVFISILSYLFSYLTFINIYIRLLLHFTTSIAVVVIVVLIQKKLIKAEMNLQKHHF